MKDPAKRPVSKLSLPQVMKLSRRIDKTIKMVHFDGLDNYESATHLSAKVFWAVIVLFTTACIVYEIYKLVDYFCEVPIVTQMSIQETDRMALPDVEICFPVAVSQKYLDRRNISWVLAMAIMRTMMAASSIEIGRIVSPLISAETDRKHRSSLDQPNEFSVDLQSESMSLPFSRILELLQAAEPHANHVNITNTAEVFQQFMDMGFDAKEVFLECMLYGAEEVKYLNCTNLLTEVLNPNFGKCFVLSLGKHHQELAGTGLTLFLHAQTGQYPTSRHLIPKVAGIMVNIHQDEAYSPYNFNYIDVPPGVCTQIFLQPEYHQYVDDRSGPKQQPCNTRESVKFEVLNVTYTSGACFVDCCQQIVFSLCGCILAQDPRFVNTEVLAQRRMCSLVDIDHCTKAEMVADNGTAFQRVTSCFNACYASCNFWRYNARVDTVDIHQPHVGHLLQSRVTMDDLIHLQVAYADLSYLSVKHQWSTDIHGLISDIGGQINLWNGATMVTIIQVMIALCIAGVSYCVRICHVAKKRVWSR